MIRTVLTATAFAVGATTVLAQAQLLPSTQLMRQMANPMYRDLNGMVKGEMPFDEAKATQAINQLSEAGAKISTAFPESSKGKTSPETRYSASPKVWTDKADFDARAARLVKAIGDNKDKIKTLDGLKAAYPAINDACNACHQDYRLRRG